MKLLETTSSLSPRVEAPMLETPILIEAACLEDGLGRPSYSHQVLAPARSRFADYLELTKPRIAVLVLFTVAIGALLGNRSAIDLTVFLHTLIGTALVAAGASALNQFFERHTDALMRRTENRPLPAGRILPLEALLFGAGLGLGGLVYMIALVRQPLPVLIAGVTYVSYVFIYTPLKRITTLNTLVGAVPGALPPLIGWTAVGGELGAEAAMLFLILFLWQVPHFLAIAWMYRDDYARAGLWMLPVVDANGVMTGRQMAAYAFALIPVTLCWGLLSSAGLGFMLVALALGAAFLWSAVGFVRQRTTSSARRVLHLSLLYLPAVLTLLLVQRALN